MKRLLFAFWILIYFLCISCENEVVYNDNTIIHSNHPGLNLNIKKESNEAFKWKGELSETCSKTGSLSVNVYPYIYPNSLIIQNYTLAVDPQRTVLLGCNQITVRAEIRTGTEGTRIETPDVIINFFSTENENQTTVSYTLEKRTFVPDFGSEYQDIYYGLPITECPVLGNYEILFSLVFNFEPITTDSQIIVKCVDTTISYSIEEQQYLPDTTPPTFSSTTQETESTTVETSIQPTHESTSQESTSVPSSTIETSEIKPSTSSKETTMVETSEESTVAESNQQLDYFGIRLIIFISVAIFCGGLFFSILFLFFPDFRRKFFRNSNQFDDPKRFVLLKENTEGNAYYYDVKTNYTFYFINDYNSCMEVFENAELYQKVFLFDTKMIYTNPKVFGLSYDLGLGIRGTWQNMNTGSGWDNVTKKDLIQMIKILISMKKLGIVHRNIGPDSFWKERHTEEIRLGDYDKCKLYDSVVLDNFKIDSEKESESYAPELRESEYGINKKTDVFQFVHVYSKFLEFYRNDIGVDIFLESDLEKRSGPEELLKWFEF